MRTLTISIPENVRLNSFELKMSMAAKLFENGKLSSGQSADLVGISKRTFIELVGTYGVSIFGYDADELEEDLKNV